MSGLQRPADYVRTVRANKSGTRGFILAHSHPCLDMRNREVHAIQRDLEPAFSDNLEDLETPNSWMLAILLCPGDTTGQVAAWAKKRRSKDRDRIRFYAHPGVDLHDALAAWYAAGLPDPRVDEVKDWKQFHKAFGLDLNDQIYADATLA
jgi:hypothetical protein